MQYSFTCYGHENITAKHKTTLEFTKDKDVSLMGDCMVGVRSDFNLMEIKKFIENKANNKENQLKNKKIKIRIAMIIGNIEEEVNGYLNPDFNDPNEMVIRKSDFASGRTLVIGADKGACGLSRNLIEMLKEGKKKIKVTIEGK